MAAADQELRAALAERERFEALALVELNHDRLLFLEAAKGAVAGLKTALEDFLLRLVADTENHDQFQQTDEFVFYDITGRQVVAHYFEKQKQRFVLVA
ncbi:MAG TPA: hypothetical protein VHO69_06610, partial [Phototrophicaceae bacterium]|nr:hypothetical protein [Phototrophicaceae bacterium]